MATLEIYPDPICRDAFERHQIPTGQSLAEWLKGNVQGYDPDRPVFTVRRNGVPLKDYRQPLAADDVLALVVNPGDPVTISLIITAISLAYQLYTYFTYKAPPGAPDLGQASPIYDANVQGNKPRLTEPIPEIFGRHLVYPDIISQPWREYESHAQWLIMLLCVGVGEYEVDPDEIFVGNTPVGRYGSDFQYQIFSPGADITGHPAHKNMYTSPEVGSTGGNVGIQIMGNDNGAIPGDWYGPYLACPLNETTETSYVDLSFPNGLYRVNRDGDVSVRTIEIEIEWRDAHAAGPWTSQIETFADSTNSGRAFTIPINHGSAVTPEFRLRRITGDTETLSRSDRCYWVGLRSELTPQTSYPDVTIMALRVKGTNVLAAQSENKFNLIVQRKLPEISGGAFGVAVATRKITSAMRYIIHDVGLDDEAIVLSDLQALENIWTPREDYFDGVFDRSGTFFESLKTLLIPGYAVPLIEASQLTAVRDQPRTVYEQMYQGDNLLPGGVTREYTLIDEDEPDGYEVKYFSRETWKPDVVIAKLDSDLAEKPEPLEAFGITDRDHAWRLGMRRRRERRYRRTQFRFATELDGLNSRFGSFCALGDDLPGYSQTGVLTHADGRTLRVSNALEFSEGAPTHFIALRKPDGTLSGPYEATAGGDEFEVIVDSDLDFEPITDGSEEPTLYQFGTATRYTEPVLITDVKPQGTESVDLVAVNYDDRVYLDDDNLAPPE